MKNGSIAEFLAFTLSFAFLVIMFPTSVFMGYYVTDKIGGIIAHNTPCEIKK